MQSNFEWRSIAHAPMITARQHEAERVIWRQTGCLQHRTERPAATSHAVQNSVAPSDEGDPTHLPQPCEASKTRLTTGPGAERYLIFPYGILSPFTLATQHVIRAYLPLFTHNTHDITVE